MRISSDRRYGFALEPDALWEAIADVGRYRDWWPWLRRFDGSALAVGEVWRCTVQPPLPYAVSFELALDEVEAGRFVVATVRGEITGSARLEVLDEGNGRSTAHLTSQLAPASRFLQSVAAVARPVVSLGHDWVLDTGARQFRRHLRSG